MSSAVVLSHRTVAHELGVLGDWLADRGYAVSRTYRDDETSVLAPADLLVVLGSPGSVAVGHCPPAGAHEVAQVREWVGSGRPYLGICYGSQVLATALGGRVTRMPEPDRGWMSLSHDADDAAFAGPWMVWHNDAVTAPGTALVRARSTRADQAFSVGRAWGVQFHPELDSAALERMAIALGASERDYGPLVAAMRDDEEAHRARALALFDTFLTDACGS